MEGIDQAMEGLGRPWKTRHWTSPQRIFHPDVEIKDESKYLKCLWIKLVLIATKQPVQAEQQSPS